MAFVTKDWKDAPDTTTPLSAAALEDLETRLGAYSDRFAGSYQTSLPGSPVDGDIIAYGADATNGAIWLLRYRSGASGSYKWEFIGGSPLTSTDSASGTVTSTSFTDLTGPSAGPTVTVPLAGDYWVEITAEALNSATNGYAIMSFSIGGTAAVEADRTLNRAAAASAPQTTITRARRKTAIAASTALTMRYRVDANTGTFADRTITVTPIRVG